MKGHILVPLHVRTSTTYQHLENGPEGPGIYCISVGMVRLTSDAILERLRANINAPQDDPPAPSDEPGEPVRTLGCQEYGEHQAHQIWVENPEWLEWWNRPYALAMRTPPGPRYGWQTCPGMA